MSQEFIKRKMHDFNIKVNEVKNGEGHWSYALVEIFDGLKKIGEYTRNYPHHAHETFMPFMKNGRWYALYSKNYTATRVMTLPECEDWCGEENSAHGFCPVEYFIPWYTKLQYAYNGTAFETFVWQGDEDDWGKSDGWEKIKEGYPDYAFVAGCNWGDDSTWKIEAFDLTKVHKKQIERICPWGYVHLPNNQNLHEAIRFSEDSSASFTMNTMNFYNFGRETQ